MKYLASPLVIVALLLIITAIFSYSTNTNGGDGLQNFWVVPMIGLGVALLIMHAIFSIFIKSDKVMLWVEAILLAAIVLISGFIFKPVTYPEFVLPDHFEEDYIILIYDVTDAVDLFRKSNRIEVPLNGVLLTNKKMPEVQSAITFDTEAEGVENVTSYSAFYDTTICSDKTYAYQVWYITEPDNGPLDIEEMKKQVNQDINADCGSYLK